MCTLLKDNLVNLKHFDYFTLVSKHVNSAIVILTLFFIDLNKQHNVNNYSPLFPGYFHSFSFSFIPIIITVK